MPQHDTGGGFSLKPREWAVLLFTLGYVGLFSVYFLAIGNHEFLWYVTTMLVLMGLALAGARAAEFPAYLLWALSLWGLAHMAGGGVQVGDSVLYAYRLVPLAGEGEFTVLKYDQVVHAYGFGVAALVLRHLLLRAFPGVAGSKSLYVFPALGAMGLGAVNEIIEFMAVVMLPDTNVGGYYNTALDLVFNALGAVLAMAGAALLSRKSSAE